MSITAWSKSAPQLITGPQLSELARRVSAPAPAKYSSGPLWPSSWFAPASPTSWVRRFGALEVLDSGDRVGGAAAAATGVAGGPEPADRAEVEAGLDASAEQSCPGGVVAPFAAVERLAVADRGREEEVVAFAPEQFIGAALVQQGVVPSQRRERVFFRTASIDEQVFAGFAARQRGRPGAAEQDDPGLLREVGGAQGVVAGEPGEGRSSRAPRSRSSRSSAWRCNPGPSRRRRRRPKARMRRCRRRSSR